MGKKVLSAGWHPTAVDYSKWPGLTPEKLEGAIKGDAEKLTALGFEVTIAWLKSSETAVDDVKKMLAEVEYDLVLIGAGVRKDPDHFLVFEALVNAVHELAPKARICFNTGPTDSDAAVQRWA